MRQAAAELRCLPEAAEASRLWRESIQSRSAVIPLLERAADIVDGIPIPAMRHIANGALAQALRMTGRLSREGDVWERLTCNTTGADASDEVRDLQFQALNGALLCALHANHQSRIVQLNAQAAHECAALPEDTSASRWCSTFGLHKTFAMMRSNDHGMASCLEQAYPTFPSLPRHPSPCVSMPTIHMP